ncbi:MAG: Rrf2 family transcriptional regulator [Deltaproteobacteria bacterium]|nr:Rrf2 family transcriptional regulator [Deltaproteobacteria bacterium]
MLAKTGSRDTFRVVKIRTRSRYAVRALLELALHYGEGPLMMQSIADKQGVSRKYLDAIFASLKSSGIVRSRRGAGGGHMLTRDPATVTLDEVFRALDGPTALVDCVADADICERSSRCVTRTVWAKVGDAIDVALHGITLADLMREHKELEAGACEHTRAYLDDDDPNDLEAAIDLMT